MKAARFGGAIVSFVIAASFLTSFQGIASAHALPPRADAPTSTSSGVSRASTVPVTTVEMNLIGHHFVSSKIIYDEFFNTGSKLFPRLLKGTAATHFWSTGQAVMELAPQKYNGHTTGIMIYPSVASTNVTVSLVGAVESSLSGDGLEAYLFLTPAHPANWSVPFYAPGKLAPCQGTVIFPYSSTPYIVVQWDPAYALYGCGRYATGDFNVYLVTPNTRNIVTLSSISTTPGTGASHSAPSAGDYLDFNVTFSMKTGLLNATMNDLNTSVVSSFLSKNLSSLRFSPGYNPTTSYYFGSGGCGNNITNWGAVYAALVRS